MAILYKDRAMTEPITEVHFGVVEVGKSKQVEVYVHNETDADFFIDRVRFDPFETGLEVVEYPNALAVGEMQRIVVKWSPPISLRRALITKIYVDGREIYRAQ